jgi:sulfoxide reductase heme-binding subunit YedZ
MVAVYASFALRRRIGARAWRRLHWATYAVFAAATAHGVMAGTDSGRTWTLALYLSAIGLVAGLVAWRSLPRTPIPEPRRSTA